MSLRQEALLTLQHQATNGGIRLQPGAGKKARQQLQTAMQRYSDARRRLLQHELATHYRVAIFGSARLQPDDAEYKFIAELAEAVVMNIDADIITGGGPGLMEAAAVGAVAAEKALLAQGKQPTARRHGEGIIVPHEQGCNPHVQTFTMHAEFSSRLQAFADISHAVYVGPGGIGTALEMLMFVQLRQVHHLEPDFPIIVHPMHEPVFAAMAKAYGEQREATGTIPLVSSSDLNFTYSDDIDEIVGILKQHYTQWQWLFAPANTAA